MVYLITLLMRRDDIIIIIIIVYELGEKCLMAVTRVKGGSRQNTHPLASQHLLFHVNFNSPVVACF